MGLLIQDKQVVVPGEILAQGMDYLPGHGTYRDGDNIKSTRLGLLNVEGRALKIVPLKGAYLPRKGDTIIGRVDDIAFSGWRFNINSAYPAMLSMKDGTHEFVARGADLTRYYKLQEYVVAKIINVTSQNLVDLTVKGPGLKKLGPGRIIMVTPAKVPRIIGKQGSMVTLIKEHTQTQITVGQNGIVWINGKEPKKEAIAVQAIELINQQAHVGGLTDRIKEFLEKRVPMPKTTKKVEEPKKEDTEVKQ
ncbi:KH domain-containing protein [Candidatus Woesearchaeota archaeon]|nr:KH domain-containing protein [Candidatus Woesearchaeota archaeon]